MKRLKMSISQSTRKCTSIILSLVMVISLFSFSMITTNATSDTASKTVDVKDATKATDVDGLVTNKTAIENADGTFTLNLEAYAKGIVTTGKVVPTDFILVLDQSGSMEDPIEYEATAKTSWKPSDFSNYYSKYYYKDESGVYYKVNVSLDYYHNLYQLYYTNSKQETIRIGKIVHNAYTTIYEENLYTSKKTKRDALKTAVSGFAKSVQQNAQKEKVEHKISMLGFGGGDYSTGILTGANGTFIPYGNAKDNHYKNSLVPVNVNGNVNPVIGNETSGAISQIKANGGTNTDRGMEMANKVLEKNNDERNKVVILFTDGQPGSGGSVESKVANPTVNSAYKSKNTYKASVYTIGLYTSGEDVSEGSDIDRFMNYTSSNYPDAQKYEGDEGPGQKVSNEYYTTVSDTETLEKIFGKIAQDSASPSIDLNASAILQDVLSDEFVLTSDGVDSVKVYTADYKGSNQFDERTEFTSAKIVINDKRIQVTGFDYAKNFCVDGQGEILTSGKKLIVEIKVKRNQTTYGGDGIPTNTIASAIYDGKTKDAVETFPIPTVYLDIRYDITVKDKSIYLGDTVKAEDLIIFPTNYNGEYNENLNINCKPDGKNNKYITIDYTFYNSVTGKSLSIRLKPGETFNISYFDNLLNDLNKNTTYVLEINAGGRQFIKFPNVYVFTPVIQATDQTIFYGDKADDLVKRLTVTSWICKDSKAEKPDSKEPVVTYDLKQVNNEAIPNNLALEDTLDVKIEKVKLNDKAVDSQYVQIINDECTLNDHADGRDFTIHVVKGQIEINKIIDAQYSNENKINSYQTFIYKIERSEKEGGEVVETFYQTLSFDASDNKTEATAIISNLKKGYYTVTEEEKWSKKYTLTSTTDNYKSTSGEEGAGKDLPIGTFDKNTGYYGLDQECYEAKGFKGNKAQVTFKNDLKSWAGWYSDAAGSKNTFNKK